MNWKFWVKAQADGHVTINEAPEVITHRRAVPALTNEAPSMGRSVSRNPIWDDMVADYGNPLPLRHVPPLELDPSDPLSGPTFRLAVAA